MDYTNKTWEEEILDAAGLEYSDDFNSENSRKVDAEMRKVDQSHLFPIRGKFNATNRAIRRIRMSAARGEAIETIGFYVALVDQEIGIIVNDPRSL